VRYSKTEASAALQRIEAGIGQLNTNLEKLLTKMAALDDKITALASAVANLTTVDASAVALINGIAAQIQTAVQAALAAGATPAELAAVQLAIDNITGSAGQLSAAVAANTPAAPPTPTPVP
jgi:alkylhydroperoxidase/carboxymuconolactone decarboxylase family protein YurZ